jgi:hypothetical protein
MEAGRTGVTVPRDHRLLRLPRFNDDADFPRLAALQAAILSLLHTPPVGRG